MAIRMFVEGDSISYYGTYVDAADALVAFDGGEPQNFVRYLDPSITYGNNTETDPVLTQCFAVPGSFISSAVARRTADLAAIAVYGGVCVLTVLIGHNDFSLSSTPSTVLTALASYLDSMRTSGIKVGVCTLLPSTITDGTLGAFNPWRNTVNTTILTWAGVHADFVIDTGNQSTLMGADAAAFNPDLYPDGIHPSIAGVARAGCVDLGRVYSSYVNQYLFTIPKSTAPVFGRF